MSNRSQPQTIDSGRVADAPAVARSPGATMLFELLKGLRRVMGLHGDAVSNAEQAVRNNEQARRHRARVADEIRALDAVYPVDAAAFETERATS